MKKQKSYCKKNIKIINYAYAYVENEFEKGYFEKEDIVGAKAQLFLIKNKSKSIFAKNIIAAENSYTVHLKKLKKNSCNISNFTVSPLS